MWAIGQGSIRSRRSRHSQAGGKRKRRDLALVGVAVVACLVLAACSSSGGSTSGSGSSPGTSASSSAAATGSSPSWLTAAKKWYASSQTMPRTIVAARLGPFKPKPGATLYLVNCLVSEGCTNFEASVKAAAAVIGYKVDVCSGNTAVQISACFQSGVNAKPNAILCTGCSNLANGPDFAKVKAARIPLITAFSGDNPPSAAVATDIAGGLHTYDAGVQIAQGIIARSNGKANIIFFTDKEYASEIATTQGFNATIKQCTTCHVKYITYSVATMTTALPTQALAVIQQNPTVNWYAGPNDGVPAAVAQAIRQSGKSGIQTASVYGYTPNLQLVRTGQEAFDIMHSHSEWGWAAVNAAARIFSGLKVPRTEDVTVVNYTQQDAAAIGPFYNGPANYQTQFKKLWGK